MATSTATTDAPRAIRKCVSVTGMPHAVGSAPTGVVRVTGSFRYGSSDHVSWESAPRQVLPRTWRGVLACLASRDTPVQTGGVGPHGVGYTGAVAVPRTRPQGASGGQRTRPPPARAVGGRT